MKKAPLIPLFLIAIVSIAPAQDRHFAWSYNTPTLPPGQVDVEAWNTFSTGREGRFFNRLRQRLEFEFGIVDNVQTSLYLNASHRAVGPLQSDTQPVLSRSSEFSFSNAWKFALLNPYEHTLGLSAYLEYYLAQGEVELEGKVMLDRLSENHWFVLNSTVEAEFEKEFSLEPTGIGEETEVGWKLEQCLGYMYHLTPNFSLGLELRNVSSIGEDGLDYSALFIGPTVFVGSEKYFLIFNAMPQVANLAGDNKPLELNAEERYVFRVLLGVSL